MNRIEIPKLYVPPPGSPELPAIDRVTYRGRRSTHGPVLVHRVAATRDAVSDRDWHGEDAVTLAHVLLDDVQLECRDRECRVAFATEILENLAADYWELTADEIRNWYRRWREREEAASCRFPPERDLDEELPGRDDEARMSELVERLGGDNDE